VAGKLIFITGASSGIGQALALRFYQAGHALALVARRGDTLAQWAQTNQLDPLRWRVYEADVSEIDSVVAAGRACVRDQGVPDVVIASAGISIGMDTAVRADLDVMARLFAVNNIGMAATFHPFIDLMRQRSGSS